MEEYFDSYESQPNCTETHIKVTFKRSSWLEYWNLQLPAALEGTTLYRLKIILQIILNYNLNIL